jgi:hypothetical protein
MTTHHHCQIQPHQMDGLSPDDCPLSLDVGGSTIRRNLSHQGRQRLRRFRCLHRDRELVRYCPCRSRFGWCGIRFSLCNSLLDNYTGLCSGCSAISKAGLRFKLLFPGRGTGLASRVARCPLLGVKWTKPLSVALSAYDPKADIGRPFLLRCTPPSHFQTCYSPP